jgi:hypothetical protein
MPEPVYGFTAKDTVRIAAATKAFERTPSDLSGKPYNYSRQDDRDGIWAKIVDSEAVEGTNHYAWTEQRVTTTGWDDMPEGMSGDTDDGYALNDAEANDDSPDPIEGTPIVWLKITWAWDADSEAWVRAYRFDFRTGDKFFYALITGSAAMSERTNVWTYSMVRAQPSSTANDWTADTSDATTYTGWNLSENINGDSGQQGNGVTIGDGVTYLAAPTGLLRLVRPTKDCDGNAIVTFEYENGIDLTCGGG